MKTKSSQQSGASMVEMALLIALIALIAVPSLQLLGENTRSTFMSAANAMSETGCVAGGAHNGQDCGVDTHDN